jgi:large subunit ribosomal protein L21
MSYAIVKTGGKQYRVEKGQSLLVERLPVDDGAQVELQPLLFVDGGDVLDGEAISGVTVQARVVGHERGPKLRVVKFKPKRGYKRRNGHRQELTRIEVTEIKRASRRSRSGGARKKSPAPVAAEATGAAEAGAGRAGSAPEAAEAAPAGPTEADAGTTGGENPTTEANDGA